MKAPAVFTVPASAHFSQALAKGLIARVGDDPLALAAATIYLPTRRAARSFGDAFAQVMGGAALLPQFRPLGDADDDDLLFDGLEMAPAITPLRRRLLLARLIRQWDVAGRDGTLSFVQAAGLAASLARVMDEAETQGADLTKLKPILPPELAEHWQGVTDFLDVLAHQWPGVLTAEGLRNPAERRNAALAALAQRLTYAPPQDWVIAAGSTGSIPATARLLTAIARLPNGAVVLPGLDQTLDAESWAGLDPGHPQYGLRQLLQVIGAGREDVRAWDGASVNAPREKLLSETLRPVPTTDAWRALAEKGADAIAQGLRGLAVVEAGDPAQEALAIALALRESLEDPHRTAALVTPDRNLARRVAAELARWGVTIDDSAGRPLAHTTAGSFLCLLAEAAEAQFAPVPLLALLKHPFARRGHDATAFRAQARALDRWCLRGPRPDVGLAGITGVIARTANARHAPPADALTALATWWDGIAAILAPLERLFARRDADLSALLTAHIKAAEALACHEQDDCLLWHGADGSAAFTLIAEMLPATQSVGAIEPAAYAPLFRNIAMGVPVRSAVGRHPRLAILGPLEARLQRFDLTVLGGLNEGAWPQGTGADPWFSRPMRAALGLEQPERAIGLAAHDFASLAAGPRVLLTRALKAEGTPTLPSRWLQRLTQLCRGLKLELGDAGYARLAARMMEVPPAPRISRPAPRPPVAARPRRLSVTEIETWLRDPYAIYARHVLRLRKLDGLDEPIGPQDRGIALHRAMELFIRRHPHALPADAAQVLAGIADDVFAEFGVPRAALALWRPRFFGAARAFVEFQQARQATIAASHLEIKGTRIFTGSGGEFILSGVADRIDIRVDGKAAILDYKSGAVPSRKQVEQLLSPQLPLEAAMLAAGGFAGIAATATEELIYFSLADAAKAAKPRFIADAEALATEANDRLARRITQFDTADMPYTSRLRPYRSDIVGDYDHLARVREWSPSGWVEET